MDHATASAREAPVRLTELSERLRRGWEQVAAQAAVLPRRLSRIATLRGRAGRRTIEGLSGAPLSAEIDTGDESPARRSAGAQPAPATPRPNGREATIAARREESESPVEALLAELRAPFLRLAGATNPAARSGDRAWGARGAFGVSRGRDTLEALAQAALRRAGPQPVDGADPGGGASPWMTDESEGFPLSSADRPSGPSKETAWRELLEGQQDLAAAVERLAARPAAWNS